MSAYADRAVMFRTLKSRKPLGMITFCFATCEPTRAKPKRTRGKGVDRAEEVSLARERLG